MGAGRRRYSVRHVVNQHPEWLARDAHGHFLLKAGPVCEGAFLTPANLFDYVRYASSSYDYSDSALARFQSEQEPTTSTSERLLLARHEAHDRLAWPHAFPTAWQAFRRRQETDMVGDISHDIKAIKPWVIHLGGSLRGQQ